MKKYCSGHFGKMLWETLNFRARALKDCDSLNKCWREALKNSARSQNQIEASDHNQDVKASSKKNQFHCPSPPSPSAHLQGFAKSGSIQAPIVILRYTIPHKKPLEEAVKIRFQNVRFAEWWECCRIFRTILWISRKYLDSLSSSSVEINRG